MELATCAPHPALAPHVRSLAGWRERADGPVRRAELPGGRIVLVISFGPTLDVGGRRFSSFVAGLHDTDGAVPIGRLAGELGWSRRRLAATVGRELGMAPKPLARLLRFERAVERLRAGAQLPDVTLDSGYYDQAHFNRDFREFAGVTPTHYRRTSVQDIEAVPA